jgi:CubicO group peptidase (beta-lactamase class C family)
VVFDVKERPIASKIFGDRALAISRRAFVAGSLAAVSCSRAPAPWPTSSWPLSSPDAQGLSRDALARIDATAVGNDSSALLIARHGYLVHEQYWGAGAVDAAVDGQSIAKSMTSMAVGVAIGAGLIPSVDTPISTWFPAIASDPLKTRIKLKHLLQMTSGLDYPNYEALQASDDWGAFALAQAAQHEPGTWWRYKTDPNISSKIVTLSTGRSARDFLSERVFSRIGVHNYSWRSDPRGNSSGSGDFSATAQDYLRLGYLYLRGGVWDGRQIVPADWIAQTTAPCRSPTHMVNDCWNKPGVAVTGPLEYGYNWWCRKWPNTPADAFYAFGGMGHFIIVIPSRDIVCVRLAGFSTSRPDGALLRNLLAQLQSA